VEVERRADRDASELQQELSSASRDSTEGQAAHDGFAISVRESLAARQALEQELRAIGELETATLELAEIAPRLHDARAALSLAQRNVADEQLRAVQAQAAVVAREKLEAELAANRTTLQQIDQLESSLARWRELGVAHAAAASEHDAAVREAKGIADSFQQSQQVVRSASVAANAARARLDSVRAESVKLEVALGVVIASITEHQTSCPVCDTHFTPSELASRTRTSHARKTDSRLLDAQASAEAAQRDLDRAEAEAAEALRQRDAANTRVRTARSRLTELDQARAALLPTALLSGQSPADLERQLIVNRGALDQEFERLSREIGDVQGTEELRSLAAARAAALFEVQNASAAAHALHATLSQRAAELSAKADRLRVHLGIQGTDEVATRRDEVARQLDRSRLAHETNERQLATLRARLLVLREREHRLQAELTTSLRQLDETRRLLGAKREHWNRLGLPGAPSLDAIEGARAAIAAEKVVIERHSATVQRLAESLRTWERAAELRDAEARFDEARGPLTREEHTDRLTSEVQRYHESLQRAERADKAARTLGDVLGARGKEYADQVVRPLDPMLERYLRALVHDTRFHDIRLKAVSHSRKGWVDLLLGADWSGDGEDVAAEAIMSEGQLSGVSLAMLLSMSAAYQWSSWRALLLDDPTQYNDLIHATALFEVLRNLVLHEGYQIVLATHDPEQADFFVRKLRAAHVECAEYRFLNQSTPRLRNS
jgi:chromosome segregation ATPase